ncbi:hypothetical protein CsSME_00044614 [Camellia sinensis var. sinensis]
MPEFICNYQYENCPKSSCLVMQSLILMKADEENDGKTTRWTTTPILCRSDHYTHHEMNYLLDSREEIQKC